MAVLTKAAFLRNWIANNAESAMRDFAKAASSQCRERLSCEANDPGRGRGHEV